MILMNFKMSYIDSFKSLTNHLFTNFNDTKSLLYPNSYMFIIIIY